MIRVTRRPISESVESLSVEGRLTRVGVARFEEACAKLLEAGQALRLDLSGLQFADREAVAALQRLRSRGVALTGASGFVEALLAEPPEPR